MAATHRYRSTLTWAGSTALGYRDYSRSHRVSTPPAAAPLEMSSDPSFRGDADRHNPEQLLLAAASSCQLLAFLAVAARAGIDVIGYDDEAEALMPVIDGAIRITKIILRPRIVVAGGTDPAEVARLVEQAHAECFIANSLAVEMVLELSVRLATGAGPAAD